MPSEIIAVFVCILVVVILVFLFFRKNVSIAFQGFGVKAELSGSNSEEKTSKQMQPATEKGAGTSDQQSIPLPTSNTTTVSGKVDRSVIVTGEKIKYNEKK